MVPLLLSPDWEGAPDSGILNFIDVGVSRDLAISQLSAVTAQIKVTVMSHLDEVSPRLSIVFTVAASGVALPSQLAIHWLGLTL